MSVEEIKGQPRVAVEEYSMGTRHSTNSELFSKNNMPTRKTFNYFEGPRDVHRHSKLPLFLRLHGGILPKMALPLVFIGGWATAVTCIHNFVSHVNVDTVLLTVLGFVVAFAVSFRSSTAYERYSEGRRYWSQLILTSRNLGRLVWLCLSEREATEEDPLKTKKDLLRKITLMNMIVSFPVALKHRLRFEPATDYPDLQHLIAPIKDTTMASQADQSKLKHKEYSILKRFGETLDLTFALSNPRKLIKRSEENLGNLPHEILSHLSQSFNDAMADRQVEGGHKFFYADVRTMADVLTGVERILNTPLPLAYTISIAQITWMYIMVLPFQLVGKLNFVTIPATMLAAYIILGLAMIGQEIENPFGNDVNDLPLESFCQEISDDLDVMMSVPMLEYNKFEMLDSNRPLFPVSNYTAAEWLNHDIEDIRTVMKEKAFKVEARRRTPVVQTETV